MADPKKNQREDEEWIGKPHPAEPDEIGKAHDPVVFDDEDRDDEVGTPVASEDRPSSEREESRTMSGGRNDADGTNAPEMDDEPKRPTNLTK